MYNDKAASKRRLDHTGNGTNTTTWNGREGHRLGRSWFVLLFTAAEGFVFFISEGCSESVISL